MGTAKTAVPSLFLPADKREKTLVKKGRKGYDVCIYNRGLVSMLLMTERTLRACRLNGREAVVCAFSGGPDSTALLLEMKRLRDQGLIGPLYAAHFEHGIRGEESREKWGQNFTLNRAGWTNRIGLSNLYYLFMMSCIFGKFIIW